MPAAPSLANQVADAVVTLLGAIDNVADPDTWLTKPQTVGRLLQASAITIEPRPVIGVEIIRFADTLGSAGRHETEVQIGVQLIVEDDVNAEKVLNALARDVILQLRSDERLGGLLKQPIGNVEYSPDLELMFTHQIGYALVSFTAQARTEHSAP